MIVAIPLFALWCGAATSQTSEIVNRQYQDGDVLASGTLDVTDSSDNVVGVTTAVANGVSVGVDTNSIAVNSRQVMTGTVRADAALHLNTGHPASA
ncbi:MAG: hypothetical protein ACXWVH_08900, partial [Caulobacteraceae bacterium]